MIDLIKSPRQILMDESGLPQLDTGLLNNTQPNGVQGHATGGAISKNSEMLPHYGIGGTIAGMVEHFLPLAEREANKAKFLEPSKVKDVLYHGTGADIKQFIPSLKTNSTFLSHDPYLASSFAENRSATNNGLPNVMPVHAQIKNPWDYENPDHVKAVVDELNKKEDYFGAPSGMDHEPKLMMGKWSTIENPEIQKIIKELGHDSFYVKEGNKKNIGVYEPNQIKSAIGNRGTYDLNDPDINHAKGGRIDNLSPEDMTAEMIYGGRTPPRFQYDKGGSVAKWAMNEVVPAAEHAINKAKFLDPSVIKNVLYHGTPHIEEAGQDLRSSGISEFNPNQNQIGMIFATKKPEVANGFAGNLGIGAKRAPAVYPVHVQVKNPFNYQNPEHVSRLVDHLYGDTLDKTGKYVAASKLNRGYWEELEKPEIQQAVKDLGHDGMLVNEDGHVNVGVFNPGQIKSAIGNRGTYDPADPNISRATGGPVHMADGKSTTLTGIDPQTLHSNYNDRMHAYMPQDAMHARYAPKQPPPAPPSTLSKVGSFLLNHGLNMGVAGLGAYDAYKGIKENNPEKISGGLGGVATSFMPFPIQAAWELATHHPEASAQQTRDTSYGPLQELMNKKQQNDANNADLWYQSTHKYKPPTSIYALDPYHPSLDNTQ